MSIVNIKFYGDFCPSRRFERIILDDGVSVLSDLRSDISESDISFLNLECPLSSGNDAALKSGPALRASPQSAKVIAQAGFNAVGLANNHIMDYGENGLLSTIDACRTHGVAHFGAGRNLEEAERPLVIERKGVKIALLAAAEVEFNIADEYVAGAAPFDAVDIASRLKSARELYDIVLITLHAGNEYFEFPRPGLRKACRFFVDQGADGVICHHSHVSGVYEFYKGKPLVYSLGNLVFDHQNPPPGWDTGFCFSLSYNASSKELMDYEVIPHKQSIYIKGVKKLTGKERDDFFQEMNFRKEILHDQSLYLAEWRRFCRALAPTLVAYNWFPFHFRGMTRVSRLLRLYKIFLTLRSRYTKLNVIRCESHREAFVSLLEDSLK